MFELEEHVPDGIVRKMKYQGAWVITNNGYLKWEQNIPTLKEIVFKSGYDFVK